MAGGVNRSSSLAKVAISKAGKASASKVVSAKGTAALPESFNPARRNAITTPPSSAVLSKLSAYQGTGMKAGTPRPSSTPSTGFVADRLAKQGVVEGAKPSVSQAVKDAKLKADPSKKAPNEAKKSPLPNQRKPSQSSTTSSGSKSSSSSRSSSTSRQSLSSSHSKSTSTDRKSSETTAKAESSKTATRSRADSNSSSSSRASSASKSSSTSSSSKSSSSSAGGQLKSILKTTPNRVKLDKNKYPGSASPSKTASFSPSVEVSTGVFFPKEQAETFKESMTNAKAQVATTKAKLKDYHSALGKNLSEQAASAGKDAKASADAAVKFADKALKAAKGEKEEKAAFDVKKSAAGVQAEARKISIPVSRTIGRPQIVFKPDDTH